MGDLMIYYKVIMPIILKKSMAILKFETIFLIIGNNKAVFIV
jgi:hypothetical protein